MLDCILISVSAETHSHTHLETIKEHNIGLIQFDRCMEQINSYKVLNDNKEASYNAARKLFQQGYKRIAFLGGPDHITIFKTKKRRLFDGTKRVRLNHSL